MVERLMIDELEDIRKEAVLSQMDVFELFHKSCRMIGGATIIL
jgi:hypothetical protein